MRKPRQRSPVRTLVAVAILLLTVGYAYVERRAPVPDAVEAIAADALRQAYDARRSRVWLTVSAPIARLLPDDHDGSRHQRFIIAPAGGPTVLVAHNIDLAPRVPVNGGDPIRLRGRYEWSAKGGTIHWTHHDPDGRLAGGWIEHAGMVYK